jgi:hypothetical protein
VTGQNEQQNIVREDSGKNALGATLPKDTGKAPPAKDNKPAPTAPAKAGEKTPAA